MNCVEKKTYLVGQRYYYEHNLEEIELPNWNLMLLSIRCIATKKFENKLKNFENMEGFRVGLLLQVFRGAMIASFDGHG